MSFCSGNSQPINTLVIKTEAVSSGFQPGHTPDGLGNGAWKTPSSNLIERGYRDSPQALVFIKQADYATEYKVTLNGSECSIKTPEATEARARSELDTIKLTKNLNNAINQKTSSHRCVAEVVGQSLHITPNDGFDFSFSVTDSLSGRALIGMKYTAKDIADLPLDAPKDYPLKVMGDPDSTEAAFHVRFAADEHSTRGIWEESVAPGLSNHLDASTMPHRLIRKQSAEHISEQNPLGIYFEFSEAPWASRSVGDLDSAPMPSFVSTQDSEARIQVSRSITAMAYFKNRLVLATDENIVASESGNYFNFFPTSVVTNLDSDPIDIAINTEDIVRINHLEATQDELLLFSDKKQFVCRGADVFSNETVQINPASSYDLDVNVKPMAAGEVLFFVNERRNFSAVWEYRNRSDGVRWEAVDVTQHVPNYLPKNIKRMAANSTQNALFMISTDEDGTAKNEIYVYDFLWQNQQRVQSAWHLWTLAGRVLDIHLQENILHLTLDYGKQGVYFEEINLQYDALREELGHPVYLDRIEEVTGQAIELTDDDPREIHHFQKRAFVGFPYEQRYVFSKLYLRQDNQAITSGRTQARNLALSYADSSHFVVEVFVDGVKESRYKEFNGRTIGSASNIIGKVPISTGTFTVPLLSRTDKLQIVIKNQSVLDARIQSAQLEMFHHSRSRRIN